MSARVNVLLLLSALLSALTGVGAHARQPQQAAVVQQVRAASVRIAAARTPARPVQARRTLADAAVAPLANVLALTAVEPLYATRLRE